MVDIVLVRWEKMKIRYASVKNLERGMVAVVICM